MQGCIFEGANHNFGLEVNVAELAPLLAFLMRKIFIWRAIDLAWPASSHTMTLKLGYH